MDTHSWVHKTRQRLWYARPSDVKHSLIILHGRTMWGEGVSVNFTPLQDLCRAKSEPLSFVRCSNTTHPEEVCSLHSSMLATKAIFSHTHMRENPVTGKGCDLGLTPPENLSWRLVRVVSLIHSSWYGAALCSSELKLFSASTFQRSLSFKLGTLIYISKTLTLTLTYICRSLKGSGL